MPASSGASATEPGLAARTLSRDELSLALIDARNRTLRWLTRFEEAGQLVGHGAGAPVPLFLIGRTGWLQEWWIGRHVQRLRGIAAGVGGIRLAGIDPAADGWFGADRPHWPREGADMPTPGGVRSYLEATLDQTLDLLMASPSDEPALEVYRAALQHEDRLAETLAVAAQTLGVWPDETLAPQRPAPSRVDRGSLWLPAGRFRLGSEVGPWVPPAERWAHDEDCPEVDIDAQAVGWARFVEFAEDGGYDDPRWWHPSGWDWLQRCGRRGPAHVEQLRGGAVATCFGKAMRLPAGQAVAHVSWYEADAWCRWAGRRLPTELEWERAAVTAGSRGFVWGDVWEWAGGTARAWPGGPAPVATAVPRRVLRGASSWTAPRAIHPRQRRFVAPERDELFAGFRSCAL